MTRTARVAAFAALLPLLVLSRGCGDNERQLVFYIDDTFSQPEVEAIVWAMQEWNREIGKCTGSYEPTFVVGGRFHDSFDLGDLTDGTHVIYRITVPTRATAEMDRREKGSTIGGHATEDVLLMRYNYPDWSDAIWAYAVKLIALHELGHTVGIAHFIHRIAVMNPEPQKEFLQDPHLTDADMEAYCIVNGCETSADSCLAGHAPAQPSEEGVDIPAIITDPETGEPIELP